jgi:L-2-hydroxyglutarate oxidase LhgO
MDDAYELIVVGGGIVGLATAWQLSRRHPELRLALVEAEPQLGMHQTSHNSGVVHAGVYYKAGSLKATLCRRGKKLLEAYCAERGIPLVRNGKIVVATRDDELDALSALYDRAAANGVEGIRRLTPSEIPRIEPMVRGVAAIHSPTTGVVDFTLVAKSLARELTESGVHIRTAWRVDHFRQDGSRVYLTGPGEEVLSARSVIACAGLQADRLAGHAADGVRIVPFRGGWFALDKETASGIKGSVYPVPDPRLPFLGVHLTRRIDGQVWAGPNAFLALSRSDYKRWRFRAPDAISALGYPGLWAFGARHLSAAYTELRHDVSRKAYAKELARYIPDVGKENLARGPIGIRAQAMTRRGELLDDFTIRRDQRILHVLNAPSPAATSSLAIGEHLADVVDGID